MKKVKEAARLLADENYPHTLSINDPNLAYENGYNAARNPYFRNGFESGSEFAQKFYPIERYYNGYIANEQSLEIERNLPVILKKEDGYKGNEYFIACDIGEVFETDHGWTHWRPVNIK